MFYEGVYSDHRGKEPASQIGRDGGLN